MIGSLRRPRDVHLRDNLFAEFWRFFNVSAAGIVIDLAIAWSLAELAGLDLVLSAAIGFGFSAVFSYMLHETWTFQGERTRPRPASRALKYAGVVGLTLAVRLGVVALLERLPWLAKQSLTILVIAVSLSFSTHYIASKLMVFRSVARDKT
jgi:putative flippase GtrA